MNNMKAAKAKDEYTVTRQRPMVNPIHVLKDRSRFSFKDYGLTLPVGDLENVDFDLSASVESEYDPIKPLILPSIDTSTESDP